MKILIVDDDNNSRYILETLLEASGYNIIQAANGAEALNKLKTHDISAIISDILMPVMDGYQLCKKVRESSAYAQIPFVFYTATYTDTKDELLAHKIGADKFVRKPTDPSVFLQIIKDVLADTNKAATSTPKDKVSQDNEVMKMYNQRLIEKLEQKMLKLELEVKSREKLQSELQIAHQELEERVKQRTAELVQTNDQLTNEIAKRAETESRLEIVVQERSKELSDAQDKIIRSEKLAAIGTLASGVGHELRNPLGVIKASAYFLKMKLGDNLDEKIIKHIQILDIAVADSDKIITDLLDFARPGNTNLMELDINYVIENTTQSIKVPKSVNISYALADNLPMINADPDQIKQIFNNLISNAIQAMPDGGKLAITSIKNGKHIDISVAGTGQGIKQDDLDKIFEPLFTTKSKGIGLGLSLVKTLLVRQGGSISASSKLAKGTTFTVKLPLSNGTN